MADKQHAAIQVLEDAIAEKRRELEELQDVLRKIKPQNGVKGATVVEAPQRREPDNLPFTSLPEEALDSENLEEQKAGAAVLRDHVFDFLNTEGRFVMKGDIRRLLKSRGIAFSNNYLTSVLSRLSHRGELYRIRYNRSNNLIHYGLPTWVVKRDGQWHYENDLRKPLIERRGKIIPSETDWNFGK